MQECDCVSGYDPLYDVLLKFINESCDKRKIKARVTQFRYPIFNDIDDMDDKYSYSNPSLKITVLHQCMTERQKTATEITRQKDYDMAVIRIEDTFLSVKTYITPDFKDGVLNIKPVDYVVDMRDMKAFNRFMDKMLHIIALAETGTNLVGD